MENGKQPAFSYTDGNRFAYDGLTKREYFAIHIATGLSVRAIPGTHNNADMMTVDVSATAVMIADALLAELEKTKTE